MDRHCFENDVVIAGTGVAAAAIAMRLLSCGFRPVLLNRGLPSIGGIESIPESALRLFDALGLTQILETAGAVWVEGFENAWQNSEIVVRPGRYIHIERTSLARAMIAEVISRGAVLVSCNTLPLLHVEHDCVRIIVDQVERQFTTAIDATGRSAIWSRAVRRHDREIAEIYSTFCPTAPLRGRIVQIPGGWVYRLGLPDAMTIGVVTFQGVRLERNTEMISQTLCLPPTQLRLIGRRPAFSQWAEAPVKDRRLAIGDAALAYNPIAGQGIRFALSSALAAAAVVRTWRDLPEYKDVATEFYHELVATERQRHLSNMNSLHIDELLPTTNQPLKFALSNAMLPPTICYVGQARVTGLYINGLIQPSSVLVLPDGSPVRWVGSFDLLTLRDLCKVSLSTAALVEHLVSVQISPEQALSLIRWCLEHKILSS